MKQDLFIHYWQLPEELFVSLKDNFHKKFCLTIQKKVSYKFKNCFHKVLNCPKWHAQRLFTKYTRFTIKEFEILRKFVQISTEEVERNLETLGNHEDGTIIKNPKLPFHLKDLVYVASHLMFDGSFRFDKGGYFYAYEPSLVEYHKERLSKFGDVPINFLERENQLYFSYTLGYIAAKILEIETFKSKKCFLSDKFKLLAKKHKFLADEIVKALIVDEGSVEDKIKIELANQRLVEDLYNIIKIHYKLTKLFSRKRKDIYFKEYPEWKHDSTVWGLNFSAESFVELYKSLSPLPIDYKQEALEFLYNPQNNNQFHRKHGETKKLITASLLKQPKTLFELARELNIRRGSVSAHIRKLPFIVIIDQRILRRGAYAKVNVFGIKDNKKARNFINTELHYTRLPRFP